jgi:hypothetical protein
MRAEKFSHIDVWERRARPANHLKGDFNAEGTEDAEKSYGEGSRRTKDEPEEFGVEEEDGGGDDPGEDRGEA